MFSDLLDKTKGFKHQITLKVELKKYKGTEIKFSTVYFNSITKAMINHKFDLNKSFRQFLYRIDNWINEGSGWIIKLIKPQYIHISTYRSLIGSFYIKLSTKFSSSKK